VARPGARPRLPGRHARGLRRRTPGRTRRLGRHRRTPGLAGPELLLPADRHRRPGRTGTVRPGRTPCGRPTHRHGLGDRRERHRDAAAAAHAGLRGPPAVRHRERLGLPRRRPPRRHGRRPRVAGLPAAPPRGLRLRHRQGRPAGRLLRLVPAGQLRVGVRLRQAVRPGPRRLRDPAAHDQGHGPPVRGGRPAHRNQARRAA
jgi:hypothetical protein